MLLDKLYGAFDAYMFIQILVFLTEAEIMNKPLDIMKTLPSAQRRKKRLLEDKQKKRLENVLYLGFNANELSDLPGFLEAPQILSVVSASMAFKVYNSVLETHFFP